MDVYAKIAKGLEERGCSQSVLAEALGWHTSKVSQATRHQLKHPPTSKEMKVIARFFGWPVDYLYDDSQNEPGPPDGLTDDERTILANARALTIEVALRRLLHPAPGERDVPG